MKTKSLLLLLCLYGMAGQAWSQDSTDLLNLVGQDQPKKEYVYNAFKSPRVIMSHSMEMLRPGVLDFRILHRFGRINQGLYDFFGLDGGAAVRLSLDYGLTNNLSIGIGRSSTKELDGFIKYRLIQQANGVNNTPVSVVFIAGSTMSIKQPPVNEDKYFSDRLSYYWQGIIGRKFSTAFTMQLMPIFLHRNLIDTSSDHNDVFAPGIGARVKLSKRISLNVDYYYVFNQDLGRYPHDKRYNPLSIGIDIETGGHVFQLHFTNSSGLNEKEFLTKTMNSWGDGDIFFGFNISRQFQIKKKKG